MEEKYSGLSNNSREFLELDDKIKENIIRRLKLVLEEYGEIFSIDDITNKVYKEMLKGNSPFEVSKYKDYEIDNYIDDILLQEFDNNKLQLSDKMKEIADWISSEWNMYSKEFRDNYNEDFFFRMDFLVDTSLRLNYYDTNEYYLNKVDDFVQKYVDNVKKINKIIDKRIKDLEGKDVVKFDENLIQDIIWQRVLSSNGNRVSAINMISSKEIKEIINDVFVDLYRHNALEIEAQIKEIYEYILANPILGEDDFNTNFENDIVYALDFCNVVYQRAFKNNDGRVIDFQEIESIVRQKVIHERLECYEKSKKQSIKNDKNEKTFGYKIVKLIKNPRVIAFIMALAMGTVGIIYLVHKHNEEVDVAIDGFTPGITRENIYTVNTNGYRPLMKSVPDFYNNVMNKYGNRDYALLGLYEAYIYVKQDRLNIMDRMLVDLKEECAKDSNYYDFFGEIVGYDNFVQYVFDRLLSLGCEDATKYEGLVSRYGDIKKQVGGKYINLNDYDLGELEDFMALYRNEEVKLREKLGNDELKDVVKKGLGL